MSKLLPAVLLALVAVGASLGFGLRPLEARFTTSERQAVQTEKESQIQNIRDQEITQLRIALGRRLPSTRRADLYLRLAEIYLEAYRAEFLLEGRMQDRRFERGERPGVIDRSFSRPYAAKGIQSCQEILKLRIPYSRMDEVYYFLAFNYGEQGDKKNSANYYSRLVGAYPSSPFAVEAYRELGEDAFRKNDFRKARQYFEISINKNPKSDSVPRTRHKLAWTYYRLKQFNMAVNTLKLAIEQASGNEKFLNLKEEGLRDMALFMSEAGRVDEALEYFKDVAGSKEYYGATLERLGAQFERNLEMPKAVRVYESLLKTNPDDEAAFRVRVKLFELSLKQGRNTEAIGRIKSAKLFPDGEADTVIAYKNLKALVRRTATENHEKYRKSSARTNLQNAEAFYALYLDRFFEDDQSTSEREEVRMYLADVKRELGKSEESAQIYKQVLKSGDQRYAKQAGSLWTASLADAIKKGGSKGNRTEPSALEEDFVDAADATYESIPNSNEGLEAQLRAAQVLAAYPKTRSKAIDRVEEIIEKKPSSPQAILGARLWLQLYSDDLGRKAQAEDAADELQDLIPKLRANSALMASDSRAEGKLSEQMKGLENRLRVVKIAGLEKEEDFKKAGSGYEDLASHLTDRGEVEKVYRNAITSYARSDDPDGINRIFIAWNRRYPGSALMVDSIRDLATEALIEGRFKASGELFERLGRTGSDAVSLETAARIWDGISERTKMRLAIDSYVTLYSSNPRRYELARWVAEDMERTADLPQAASFYKYCMAGKDVYEAICASKLGDLYLDSKDEVNARRAYEQGAQLSGKMSASPYVAYSRFRLGELIEKGAKFAPFSENEAALKKALSDRLGFLEPLSRAYQRSVQSGGPWAIASLDHLAAWADRFADELTTLQGKLAASGKKELAQGLQQVVTPLKKKAQDTWMEAAEKAQELELLSPALAPILDRLAARRVPGSLSAQGEHGVPRIAGVPADGGERGRDAIKDVRAKLKANARDAQAWVDYGNLLWGEGKPGMSEIAYDQALSLKPSLASALNNRAVVLLGRKGMEDWAAALEANSLLKKALEGDSFLLAAKLNRALLLNYYRLFRQARPLWEQVLFKMTTAEVLLGLGVSQFGTGDLSQWKASFQRAEKERGYAKNSFIVRYHFASSAFRSGKNENCTDELDRASLDGAREFERESLARLKATCSQTKGSD